MRSAEMGLLRSLWINAGDPIEDCGTFERDEAYAARLQAEPGRKSSFWTLIPGSQTRNTSGAD
jgi:hypothetical protein